MQAFTLQEICEACGGTPCDALPLEKSVTGVCIDSRTLQKDELFVPIVGERFDGHAFIETAMARGALAALTARDMGEGLYIRVADTLAALQAIAGAYRDKFRIPFIGITGSVGKTTTKEMIYGALATTFNTLKTEGNLNNQTGVPLTLFRLENAHEAAVIEMGTNHFGEIDALARMVKPDICVLTNIGESHIEYLGSKAGILRAKAEMLAHRQPGAHIVVNGDDPYLRSLAKDYTIITYGTGTDNDVYATDICQEGLCGVSFSAHLHGQAFPVTLCAPGSHMVRNALCAIACGGLLGIAPEKLAAGVRESRTLSGRLHIQKLKTLTLINDAYNASPTAMRSSIGVAVSANTRSVLILGDMFELGADAPRYHAEIGKYAAEAGADVLLCVGELSNNTYEAAREAGADARHYKSKEALIQELPSLLRAGDTVLVKASHGMHLDAVAEHIAENW